MESVWSVSKLSTESVGSRRQLVANCVHTADAEATKRSAVCIGHKKTDARPGISLPVYHFENTHSLPLN